MVATAAAILRPAIVARFVTALRPRGIIAVLQVCADAVESALISSATPVKHLIDHFIGLSFGDLIWLNPLAMRPFRLAPLRDAAPIIRAIDLRCDRIVTQLRIRGRGKQSCGQERCAR